MRDSGGHDGGMTRAPALTVDEFFAGDVLGARVCAKVSAVLDAIGPYAVRATKSQVAFRKRRGFACLWRPGTYLKHPTAEIVLSIALGRHDLSPRFKQVAHPASHQWMHHLEIRDVSDIDDQVAGWLREAAARAS
jgi:hypothetical protein